MRVCKCCVCYRFFNSRLPLKQHLLLRCIRIMLPRNDRPPSSKDIKCHSNIKGNKCKRSALKILLRSQSTEHQNDRKGRETEHQEIDDSNRENPKENLHVSNIENLTNQINESKENIVGDLGKINDQQEDQTVSVELTNPLECNNTEDSPSKNNDLIEEPIPVTPTYTAGEFTISNTNEDEQIDFILHGNVIQVGDSYNNESIPEIDATVNKKKYPFSICETQFQKPENLFQHVRTYDYSFNNFCEICGLFFSSKKILRTHNNTAHNFAICSWYTLHCQFCNQRFRTENNLRIHELHYHTSAISVNNITLTEILKVLNGGTSPSLPTVCDICGLCFNTYKRYELHSMYFYEDHIFQCTFCVNIFHGLNMIHHHNKLFHYPRNSSTSYKYKCSICCEDFAIESYFLAHKLHVHSNKEHVESSISNLSLIPMHYNKMSKSYLCSKCNIEFYSVVELLIHIEYYSNRGNYLCSKCPRKCCTLSILSKHINLTHSDNELIFGHKCGICGEILLSDISFLFHKNHLHIDDVENQQVVSSSYKS
ncbi:RB-associated KRAB zinc finger protein-like [Vespa velutina]|uniref:RB-associated KRAB zinc finger protein-like n=1 Tax=Vespa velutina TaxID=202808 RepID=UPI001FB349D1|nr:RB-associated KRAB zinc finger protein-like [Vespa velutina]